MFRGGARHFGAGRGNVGVVVKFHIADIEPGRVPHLVARAKLAIGQRDDEIVLEVRIGWRIGDDRVDTKRLALSLLMIMSLPTGFSLGKIFFRLCVA